MLDGRDDRSLAYPNQRCDSSLVSSRACASRSVDAKAWDRWAVRTLPSASSVSCSSSSLLLDQPAAWAWCGRDGKGERKGVIGSFARHGMASFDGADRWQMNGTAVPALAWVQRPTVAAQSPFWKRGHSRRCFAVPSLSRRGTNRAGRHCTMVMAGFVGESLNFSTNTVSLHLVRLLQR
jgi:hypothetical protein